VGAGGKEEETLRTKQESLSDRTGLQSKKRLADRHKRQGDWQAGQAGRIYLTKI
jgi:hypothetical protein